MAGNVNHEYHILEPDIWPFVASVSALTFTSGMVLYMHEMASAHLVLGLGIAGLIATFFGCGSSDNSIGTVTKTVTIMHSAQKEA